MEGRQDDRVGTIRIIRVTRPRPCPCPRPRRRVESGEQPGGEASVAGVGGPGAGHAQYVLQQMVAPRPARFGALFHLVGRERERLCRELPRGVLAYAAQSCVAEDRGAVAAAELA
ncbi:hypothetical protein STSP_58860 [Streptomyces jeddahensis]|uniref:Uncharacterized protein n=1 Tax=Streptomyces jeddahensis TaxID=1716141 RepID=A0A177HKL5_9ACTN|nr:hypothetical protein STSP_58860 [Streptomyces jeddahensis]